MSTPKIAIVAIHGVGDHQPCEMANGVGDLLEDLEDRHGPRFCPFGETKIRINVSPVVITGKVDNRQRTWGPMGNLYESGREIKHSSAAETDSLDHLFLEGQLAEYKPEG